MSDDNARPCTPDFCSYGEGHACPKVWPDNFPPGSSTVWRKRRDAALYGTSYRE